MPIRDGWRVTGTDPRLTVAAAVDHIRVTCGLPSAGPTVGAEVEWLVVDPADRTARPTVRLLRRVLGTMALPGGCRISYEPGGQVELSSPPGRTPDEVHHALALDEAALKGALRAAGLDLRAAALDPIRPPARVSDSPRYESMAGWFAGRGWDSADEMMCNTTSVQVNVGCGPDPSTTWRRAHAVSPVLAAAFASSPGEGWESGRLRSWAAIDPSRTATALSSGDAIEDWIEFALGARVILRHTDGGSMESVPGDLSFRQWIQGSGSCPPPTLADLDLHLSTLFPPVRLKAWIEIRVMDMPSDGNWTVPMAVTAALLCHPPEAPVDEAWMEAVKKVSWQEAGRQGLRHPDLAVAADQCFVLAHSRLRAQGSVLADTVERFRREKIVPRVPALAHGNPEKAAR